MGVEMQFGNGNFVFEREAKKTAVKRRLSQEELAVLVGLPKDAPITTIKREYLEAFAETEGLSFGLSPQQIYREILTSLQMWGQQLTDEGHPIIGGIVKVVSKLSTSISKDFKSELMSGEEAHVTVGIRRFPWSNMYVRGAASEIQQNN